MTTCERFLLGLGRRPLAACAATLFAMTTPQAIAANVVVTSCADDGTTGTLRHAVLVANTGDTVDLSGLACSKITLQSGAISTSLQDLTIAGSGAGALTIDGNQSDRVFTHLGAGTLTLSGVTVANGKLAASIALGGCIYSKGNVTLTDAAVTSCTAQGQSSAAGGGVMAVGEVNIQFSAVSGNTATAQAATSGKIAAAGGGVYAPRLYLYDSRISGNTAHASIGIVYGGGVSSPVMTAKYSTFTGNQATSAGTTSDVGVGGGLATTAKSLAGLLTRGSTIDHNTADFGGGIFVSQSAGYTANLLQTTISSNTGKLVVGALAAEGDLSLIGCTIAFNESTSGIMGDAAVVASATAGAQSTIIADNTPIDIDFTASGTLGGDHNLIKVAGSHITIPTGAAIEEDPILGPLDYHGGPTRTHALGAASPAINVGSNPGTLATDQRGQPYKRVVGSSADIGAYELDTDHIFGDGFAPNG